MISEEIRLSSDSSCSKGTIRRPLDDSSEISVHYSTSGYSTPCDDAEREISPLFKTNSHGTKIEEMIKARIAAFQGKDNQFTTNTQVRETRPSTDSSGNFTSKSIQEFDEI